VKPESLRIAAEDSEVRGSRGEMYPGGNYGWGKGAKRIPSSMLTLVICRLGGEVGAVVGRRMKRHILSRKKLGEDRKGVNSKKKG